MWERVKQCAGNIEDSNELVGQLQKYRFKTIIKYKPDLVYYGNGGFHGYLVFVFKRKGLVLMENMIYGKQRMCFSTTGQNFPSCRRRKLSSTTSRRRDWCIGRVGRIR